MTPRGRRASRRVVVSSLVVFVIGAIGAACNMLTGAGDLAPCEGAGCPEPARGPDGTVTTPEGVAPSGDAGGDRPSIIGPDGAPVDGTTDASTEGGPMCPLCDGGACCAPSTCVVATGICGACSAADGPCQLDSDCCSGLKCSARGECVSSCRAEKADCSFVSCCLGTKCAYINGSVCNACKLHGSSCFNNGACCSGNCVGGTCIGNTNPSGPGK